MRSLINPNLQGLEIGPSFSPICPKSAGYNVDTIDHLSQSDLRKKYADHGVDLDAIEPVDFVWTGDRTYSQLTGKTYDWVIASHVIEHTPDIVSFLQNCEQALNPQGVLALAVPDKRYCFDHLRQPTSLASVLDAYEQKRTTHGVGTAADYFLNVVKLKTGAWASSNDLEFVHTDKDVRNAISAVRSGAFLDVHSWCFTPSSFRLMIEDLYLLGLTQLRETKFYNTVGNEFMIALSRDGKGPLTSRLALCLAARSEVKFSIKERIFHLLRRNLARLERL